jgi:hypothetical protein
MTNTADLTTTAAHGIITLTITDEAGTVETHTVKDGKSALRNIDRKLADLLWNRSGFGVGMTATLTRSPLFVALTAANAR